MDGMERRSKASLERWLGAFGVLAALVVVGVIASRSALQRAETDAHVARLADVGNKVRCKTTKGEFQVLLTPELAPNGTKFFRESVIAGYWDQGIPFWRVNKHITQFGITKKMPRESDPFIQIRNGALRDVNPYGGVGDDDESKSLRKANPWRRGTIASIGGFHFVIVIRANKHMGVNRHDAPLGMISEDDMSTVLDKLYAYNDNIDNKRGPKGPDQTKLNQEGPDYIRQQFPLTDWILSCKLE